MTPPWVGGWGVKAYCYKIVQQLRYHRARAEDVSNVASQ